MNEKSESIFGNLGQYNNYIIYIIFIKFDKFFKMCYTILMKIERGREMRREIINILVLDMCFLLTFTFISPETVCRRVKQVEQIARLKSFFEWLEYKQTHPGQKMSFGEALTSGNISSWISDELEMKKIILEIGKYGSRDEKNEAVIFLLQKASPYEGHFVRKMAVYCLKELFPYLNDNTKRLILNRLDEEYVRYSQQIRLQGEGRNPLRQFLGVISQFVPQLTEEEIKSISPITLTALAYYCAETLLESDIEVLSKVIRYVSPSSQKEALMILARAFSEEYDPAYQEAVGSVITDLIINNIPYCKNSEFLEGSFKLTYILLDKPATFKFGKEVAQKLMPLLDPSEKKQLQDLLDPHA